MTLLYSAKFLSHRRDRGANSRQGDQCHSKSEGALPNYAIDAGLVGKTYEERKEFPPWDLETISVSEFVIFGNLKKYWAPLWYNSALLSAKNLPQQGLILGLTNTYPTVSRYPQRKKKHDRFQASRVAMAQKTTARFEHFTELIIIKCNSNITIWLFRKDFWVSSILPKTNENKST